MKRAAVLLSGECFRLAVRYTYALARRGLLAQCVLVPACVVVWPAAVECRGVIIVFPSRFYFFIHFPLFTVSEHALTLYSLQEP